MSNKNNATIQMIADFEGDITSLFNEEKGGVLPILATRNIVLFPGVMTPILIGREASLNLLEHIGQHPTNFAIFSQKDENVNAPKAKDLYPVGVFARLIKVIDMPGANHQVTAIVQGLGRCELESIVEEQPFLVGNVLPIPEEDVAMNNKICRAAYKDLLASTRQFITDNEEIPNELQYSLDSISQNLIKVNYICCNLPFAVKDKFNMLKQNTILERIYEALKALHREQQYVEIKKDIRSKTREDLDEQQREYFLQQQIKNIKEELGNGNGTTEKIELEEKAKGKKWPEDIEQIFRKELDKLDLFNPQSPEYSTQVNYLQNLVSLPWGVYSKDDLSLKRAKHILDHDHYGMEKVKDRILEYIAVLSLRGDLKSPIICLYGPPGVGKTSLGKSIAEALKRKYVRISLGGLHDESEIRGHRRTYIGAMPGRIIKSVQKAGTSNPV